jgi:hypothetical protein
MQESKQATLPNSDPSTCNMTVMSGHYHVCILLLLARGYLSFLDPCPTLQLPHMHIVENLSGWNLTLVPF